jgi:AraC-like DNA-binding protein
MFYNDTIYLSTSKGILLLNAQLEEIEMINHPDVLQSIKIEKSLLFTSNNGLYVIDQNQKFSLVENIEFNRKGLTVWDDEIYAGAVDGLYRLTWSNLKNTLLNVEGKQISSPKTTYKYLYPLLISLVLSIGLLAFILSRKNKEKVVISITSENLKKVIRENPKVQSVEDLAYSIGISKMHLNRKLKDIGKTPGDLLRESKKDLARELHGKGTPIDKIARRVGYSERYIKENFLSKE